jgi:hypothetical protein
MFLVVTAFLAIYVLLNASAASIANSLRMILPIGLFITGLAMMILGRFAAGLPMLFFSAAWYVRSRNSNTMAAGRQTSTVRSAWLEMTLDHETGDLEGLVLTGNHDGEFLSTMDGDTLLKLYADLSGDAESAALMEAYLDRRIPGWREASQTDFSSRTGDPVGSGPMTKQEAYQVLGLEAGAGIKEIRTAHRRLMKAVHPDSGGSTFLAARINEAKDILLG